MLLAGCAARRRRRPSALPAPAQPPVDGALDLRRRRTRLRLRGLPLPAGRSTLREKPARFVVHVTADNRYQLFVNGARVAWGPARGDLDHWRYETLDLAPYLKAGQQRAGRGRLELRRARAAGAADAPDRLPAAGRRRGARRPSIAARPGRACATTPTRRCRWRRKRSTSSTTWPVPAIAWTPGPTPGAGRAPEFDDSRLARGARRAARGRARRRRLAEPMDAGAADDPADGGAAAALRASAAGDRGDRARRLSRAARPPSPWPPRTRATVLLDQGHLATAYPELTVSGGRGAVITLRHAEALLRPGTQAEGPPRRGRRQGAARRPRHLRGRRRIAADVPAALVAHLPLRPARDRDGGRAAHHRRPGRHRHRLSLRPKGAARRRTGRSWTRDPRRRAGARRGCARTRPTWTARTTSSSSTPATRASRPWSPCT